MGAFFRSEEMVLAQLFIQPEAAYYVISELGETGTVQFRDLNEDVNAFQKKFVNEVRRCDELERKLRYIENEVNKEKVKIPDITEFPRAPNPREMIDLEAHLEKNENEIKELSESAVNLKSNYLELIELRQVLEKTQQFFNEQGSANEIDTTQYRALVTEDMQTTSSRGRLGFIAGVIKRERVHAFERMLWRISRGNILVRQAEVEQLLEDPATGHEMKKTVFVAFFQGEQLKSRIKKVCAGFHAAMYPCPDTVEERVEMLKGVKTKLKDLEMVLNQTNDHRQRVLVTVAKDLQNWSIMVNKMKAIYYTLNYFNVDVTKKCLIGECWVPSKDISIVQKALVDGSLASGSTIPSFLNVIVTSETPPTFNRTNKFTKGFQNLIDSYGVASYREVNPALYTIITFPFLFAVMFGDVGHALIMFGFSFYMILAEKKLQAMKNKGEIFNIFFAGRYIILLMSLFSVYTGFIYNDFFSKALNIFGSSWTQPYDYKTLTNKTYHEFDLDPADKLVYKRTPYPFGVDPIWQLAENKIIFLNSFKMKLSIILGVTHMIFGVIMSIPNFVYFRQINRIFLEFIPQIVFLCCLFLWMVIMIFWKWFMYRAEIGLELDLRQGCAPSVLIFFINMMLMKSPTDEEVKKLLPCKPYMFDFQQTLQQILFGIAMICIPIMLFGRPLYLKMQSGKKKSQRNSFSPNGEVRNNKSPSLELLRLSTTNKDHINGSGQNGQTELDNATVEISLVTNEEIANSSNFTNKKSEEHDEEHESFGELMIHQAIHTIEYVLSTVSHTASYLRLWALSLAHAQLSEVLWNMVFKLGLQVGENHVMGSIRAYIFFAAWAFFTVAILVLMEGLSAFLHTLRLHWVEFMSKFYTGEGYLFKPFSFKSILDDEAE